MIGKYFLREIRLLLSAVTEIELGLTIEVLVISWFAGG